MSLYQLYFDVDFVLYCCVIWRFFTNCVTITQDKNFDNTYGNERILLCRKMIYIHQGNLPKWHMFP